jgi:chlorobactene glucosyltransferase
VIVPARNEARYIRRCAQALLAQTYPNLELIVVDDRSTDATPAILAELQAAEPAGTQRLRVLRGLPPPAGWAGKAHALWQGAQAARGEWLCFVDADTFAGPELIAAAWTTAEASAADLFSLLTYQRLETFWERVVMPVVFSALAVGFPTEAVNDPARPEAIANGQFILIRRAVYDALGGHAALRGSIVEDKELAERVKRQGYRLLVADGRALAETRMYVSLSEMWEGWTKNIYLGMRDRPGLLAFGGLVALTGALALPAWLLAGLAWLARGGRWPAAAVSAQAAAVWAAVVRARARVSREMGLPPAYAFSLPLGALVFAGLMFSSTWRVLTRQGVTWKGRRYEG